MRNRIRAFAESYNKFLDVIETNKPFYPDVIYKSLADVREKCRREQILYQYIERPTHEYYEEAMINHEEILTLIDTACIAIRNRIFEVRTT